MTHDSAPAWDARAQVNDMRDQRNTAWKQRDALAADNQRLREAAEQLLADLPYSVIEAADLEPEVRALRAALAGGDA